MSFTNYHNVNCLHFNRIKKFQKLKSINYVKKIKILVPKSTARERSQYASCNEDENCLNKNYYEKPVNRGGNLGESNLPYLIRMFIINY